MVPEVGPSVCAGSSAGCGRGGLAADQKAAIVFVAFNNVVAARPADPASLDQARVPRVQETPAGNRVSLGAIGEIGGAQAPARDQGHCSQRPEHARSRPALAALAVLPMSNWWEIDARAGAYEGKTTTAFASAIDANTKSGTLSKSSTS